MKLPQTLGLSITLALGVSIGVTLAIVGCALYSNGWWALFSIVCYLFAPIPDIFGRLVASRVKDADDDATTGWEVRDQFFSVNRQSILEHF